MPKTQIGEIVVGYLKSMTSDFNNRTLARKIVQENPHKTLQVFNFEIKEGQIIY